jgi:hypothetical protein
MQACRNLTEQQRVRTGEEQRPEVAISWGF